MDDKFNELMEEYFPLTWETGEWYLKGGFFVWRMGQWSERGQVLHCRHSYHLLQQSRRDLQDLDVKTTSYSGSSGGFSVEESTWILFFWRSASPGLSSTFSKKSLSTRNRIAWDKFETVFLISGNSN